MFNIGDAVGSEIDQQNVTDDTHTHQISVKIGTMIHKHYGSDSSHQVHDVLT